MMQYIDFIWHLNDNRCNIDSEIKTTRSYKIKEVCPTCFSNFKKHIKEVCPTIYFKLKPTAYEN